MGLAAQHSMFEAAAAVVVEVDTTEKVWSQAKISNIHGMLSQISFASIRKWFQSVLRITGRLSIYSFLSTSQWKFEILSMLEK